MLHFTLFKCGMLSIAEWICIGPFKCVPRSSEFHWKMWKCRSKLIGYHGVMPPESLPCPTIRYINYYQTILNGSQCCGDTNREIVFHEFSIFLKSSVEVKCLLVAHGGLICTLLNVFIRITFQLLLFTSVFRVK